LGFAPRAFGTLARHQGEFQQEKEDGQVENDLGIHFRLSLDYFFFLEIDINKL